MLLAKLDDILAQFAEFRDLAATERLEYKLRTKRFKLALVGIVLVLAAVSWAGLTSYRTAKHLESFVACQFQFNEAYNRASAIRAKANQAWTTSTLAYGTIRNDPKSTPEQIAAARKHYYETLEQLAQTQQANQIPLASNCRLGA